MKIKHFIVLLVCSVWAVVAYGQQQPSRTSEFVKMWKSYRTFSEFDVFCSLGVGEYPMNRGGITFSLGKQIIDEFSCSVLLGLEWYPKYNEDRPFMYSTMLMPVGINIKRYFVSNPKKIPHLSLDLGYSIPSANGGFFAIPAVGLGIGNLKFQVGYNMQSFKLRTSDEVKILSTVQLKAGFFF